jgi:coenzyme Q-binding protein COQ10
MPKFETIRRLPYSPRQMFDLVADIEQYPRFFPLCEAIRVISRDKRGDSEVVVAAMDIGYRAIRETITTRVNLDGARQAVRVDLVDGPFRRLENRWRFDGVPSGGCDVRFFITYEFKSLMLQLLVGALFDQAFRRCVSAFEARAKQVYGRDTDGVPVPAT